jgi:hypothetical protein
LQDARSIRFVEQGACNNQIMRHQPPLAEQIDVDDLGVGIDVSDVVLPRNSLRMPVGEPFFMSTLRVSISFFPSVTRMAPPKK